MKRLRTLVQRLEERVDAIENVKRHDPGHGQEDNEMARAGRALRQMRRNVYGTATTSPLPLDYEKRSPFMPRPAGVPLTPPHTQHPFPSNPLHPQPPPNQLPPHPFHPQQPHPPHPQHPLPTNPLPPHPPAPNPPGAGDSPLPPLLNPALFRLSTYANVDVNVGQRHEPQTLWHFGALEPGLAPLETLLPDFRKAIDYRSYRLANTSLVDNQSMVCRGNAPRIVQRMRALLPQLKTFDGKEPIALLTFLSHLRRALDGVQLTEGAAVRIISWFLEGDALQTYASCAFTGVRRAYDTMVTWPRVVNALLERYLTDDILGDALNRITSAMQKDEETETAFMRRIETYADECCGVFDEFLVVNYFLRGLRPVIRPTVTQKVHELPSTRRTNLNVVRRIAQAEGDAHRAREADFVKRLRESAPTRSPKRGSSSPGSTLYVQDVSDRQAPPAMLVEPPPSPFVLYASTDTASPTSPASADVTIDATKARIDGYFPTQVPTLTDEQRAMALSMIPDKDEWMICWFCREGGHSMYRCTFLTEAQQLHCAYCNYVYQYETRPNSRTFLRQRVDEVAGRKRNDARGGSGHARPPMAPKSVLRREDYGQRRAPSPSRFGSRRPPRAAPTRAVHDAIMALQDAAGPDVDVSETVLALLAGGQDPKPIATAKAVTIEEPAQTLGDSTSSSDEDVYADSKKE